MNWLSRTIKSSADLDRAVAQAQASGQAVMLDFYADWCVSCKEMEKYTFTDPAVRATLKRVVLLRADVTANDTDDQALLKRFGIYGPPTIAFYGVDGAGARALSRGGFHEGPGICSAQCQGSGQRRGGFHMTPVARAVLGVVLVAGAGPAGFLIYHLVFNSHPLPVHWPAPASTPTSVPPCRTHQHKPRARAGPPP